MTGILTRQSISKPQVLRFRLDSLNWGSSPLAAGSCQLVIFICALKDRFPHYGIAFVEVSSRIVRVFNSNGWAIKMKQWEKAIISSYANRETKSAGKRADGLVAAARIHLRMEVMRNRALLSTRK